MADVDELVRRFTEAEEKNFSLLTHSNQVRPRACPPLRACFHCSRSPQLSEEIERMEAQIAEAETEVERYRGLGAHHDNQRKRVVHELQERLRRTEDKIMEYESRAAVSSRPWPRAASVSLTHAVALPTADGQDNQRPQVRRAGFVY